MGTKKFTHTQENLKVIEQPPLDGVIYTEILKDVLKLKYDPNNY
jgi:hypothetical protein